MKFNFEKGQVKKIYEFNQEAKNIFDDYYMFTNNGLVIGKNNLIGTHYIESGFKLYNEPIIQVFDSRDLYERLKTGRKDIIEYEYRDYGFYINGNPIGYTLSDSHDYYYNSIRMRTFIQEFNESHHVINLSDEDIYDLTKNKILELECGEYMSKISRKIIPGLKKSHKIQIRFYDDKFSNVFNMHIRVDRKVLISNHIYKCIKF